MASIAPLPPDTIRQLLEAKGYKLVAHDDYNWAFSLEGEDEPVIVPHAVVVVPLEVAHNVLTRVGFDAYVSEIYKQEDPWPPMPPGTH